MCSYFINKLQDLTNAILSVVDDVLFDGEMTMVASSISKICWLGLFEATYRDRVACMNHRVSMHVYM